MKKMLALSAVAVSLGASSIALADNNMPLGGNPQSVKGGIYVGGSLGYGGMDTPKKNMPLSDIAQSGSYKLRHGVAYRIDGGYLFPVASHFLLGAELGYTGYPKNQYKLGLGHKIYSHLTYAGSMFDALLVAKYYIGTHFNMFGKAGAAYVSQKTSWDLYNNNKGEASSNSFVKKSHKILPEVAVGLGYDFTPSLGVDVTYSHVFGKKPNFTNTADIHTGPDTTGLQNDLSQVASVNTVLVGLTYKFSM